MEDLDGPRTVPGAAARILEDLRWLGLDWDEGPDTGGPHAPYQQSERSTIYRAAIETLGDRVFECWCSRAEIARAASAPHAGEDGPRYPGTCRTITSERRAQLEREGRRPSLRLRVDPGEVNFIDMVAGRHSQDVSAVVGDFVLRRADGLWAYQLAVVVDDAAMAIEEVVRGDDLLASTPRQLLLADLLGAPRPRYAHLPLVLGKSGQRLAKRDGPIASGSVRALREAGMSSVQIIGRLAATLGLCPPGEERAPSALLHNFTFAQLHKDPALVDPASWIAAR